jgi:hypothetical protein
VRVAAQAIVALTHVDPVPRDSALTELRLVQTAVLLRAAALHERLALIATLNLEGTTMRDGELTPGAWGEGFVDRRHPHTYAHELILSWRTGPGRPGRARAGLTLGKGFVSFGTDDPMARPTVRYPVNHHLSQILERAVLQVSAGAGPLVAEATLFNGDEPERPSQWPNWSRFGDSWAARVTLLPRTGVEAQVSHAVVASPEHRPGAASDQHKWSASLRWDRPVRRIPVYGLIEWARTSELDGFFVFHSLLAEVAVRPGRHGAYYRLERTERPEEQRLLDPFRAQRPHLENTILGITRWTVHTAGYVWTAPRTGRLAVRPFAEASLAGVTSITGGVFDPVGFYGRDTIWSLTVGARFELGSGRRAGVDDLAAHRMGRYGVLADSHTH